MKVEKKESNLYRLIHQLNKNEKGYFKKYTLKHGAKSSKQYILLFDAYDKIKFKNRYDETKILKKLPIEIQHFFASKKNYLYNLILEALRVYYASNNHLIILLNTISDVHILINKGLYHQAIKIIKKGNATAEKYELFDYQLILLNIESEVKTLLIESFERNEELLDRKKEKVIKNIELINKYKNINGLIFKILYTKNDGLANPTAANAIKKILHQLDVPDKTYPLYINCLYQNMLASYYLASGKRNKTLLHREKALLYFYKNNYLIKSYPLLYIWILNSYIIEAHEINHHEKVESGLVRFRELYYDKNIISNRYIRVEIFRRLANTELDIIIKSKKIDKSKIEITEKYITDFSLYAKYIPIDSIVVFYYNFAYIYFLMGDSNRAMQWNNKILHKKYPSNIREDVQRASKSLNLMLHYDMGNSIYLENLIAQMMKNTLDAQSPLFKEILSFFRALNKLTSKKSKQTLYKSFLFSLNNKKYDIIDQTHMEGTGIKKWIESKIQV